MLPTSKQEAISKGASHYFTGLPCNRGHVSRRSVNGHCLKCQSENQKAARKRNPISDEKRAERIEYLRAYREEKGEELNAKMRKAYAEKREERLLAKRRAYHADPEKMRARARAQSVKRREKISAYMKEYCKANRKKLNRQLRERLATDPVARCAKAMRTHLRRVVEQAGTRKINKTSEMIGYSPSDLLAHLERQFSKGMTWDNYGEWHIDHITPICEMVRHGITDPAAVNCLSNLRPLWATENHSKGGRTHHLL